jgi:hypothetical protein
LAWQAWCADLVSGVVYGGLDLAGATGPPSIVTGQVTVGNTPANPVPVRQQGTATVTVRSVADWPGFFPSGPDAVAVLIAAGADPNAAIEGSWHKGNAASLGSQQRRRRHRPGVDRRRREHRGNATGAA